MATMGLATHSPRLLPSTRLERLRSTPRNVLTAARAEVACTMFRVVAMMLVSGYCKHPL